MENETINYTITEHTGDAGRERGGDGWYFSLGDVATEYGPYETREQAEADVLETIEQSVADALVSALFGEAA
ncbi:hypothetical protein EV128_125129 [Rhizobium azibense]|nr:hypothetical protein EV128_125129 [Rhizobium azibense]